MAISTYAQLRTAVENWSKRGDIASVIDDFIALAESDIAMNLKIRDMEARATASTNGTRYLELPDSFLQMRKLRLVLGTESYELSHETPESMDIIAGSGPPRNFTVTTQLEFDRTPGSTYTAEMQYYKSLTALSSSNTTNAVLTRFPAVYLYGCLFHFGLWAHIEERLLLKYSELFDEEMKRANKIDRRGRYGPVPSMRIEGSTP